MIDEIPRQIEWLRRRAFLNPNTSEYANNCANSLENLLAVYEAAKAEHFEVKGMLAIERYAIAELVSETNMRCLEGRVETMDNALDAVQNNQEK